MRVYVAQLIAYPRHVTRRLTLDTKGRVLPFLVLLLVLCRLAVLTRRGWGELRRGLRRGLDASGLVLRFDPRDWVQRGTSGKVRPQRRDVGVTMATGSEFTVPRVLLVL